MTGGLCLLRAHMQGARGFAYIEGMSARITARGLKPGGDAALCLRGGGVTRARVSDGGDLDAVLPLRGGETVLLIACDTPPRPALSAAIGGANLPSDAVAMLCEEMCRALTPCEPIRHVPPDAGEQKKRKRSPQPRPTLRRIMPVAKPAPTAESEAEASPVSEIAQKRERLDAVPVEAAPKRELPEFFELPEIVPPNPESVHEASQSARVDPEPDSEPAPVFRARGDEPALNGLVPLVWPPAAEPLKPYFLTLPPCAPFDAPGWRFVRVPMPRGGGLSHCAVGYKAHQRVVREIACAVPGGAEQAPPGLHGYRWQAGRDLPGYWTLWKRV